jgi:hypothetical protein
MSAQAHAVFAKRMVALPLHPHPSGTVVAKHRATTVPLDLPREYAGEEIEEARESDLSSRDFGAGIERGQPENAGIVLRVN